MSDLILFLQMQEPPLHATAEADSARGCQEHDAPAESSDREDQANALAGLAV